MAERADAFIILPGGYGTFEEMFEVLAWQTLKIHSKPVVLLNVAGFYDTMLRSWTCATARECCAEIAGFCWWRRR